MADDLIHDQAAAYALDALDAQEREVFEAHLAGCEQCREEVAALSETAASLAFAAPTASPPASLRARILDGAHAGRENVVPLRPRWAVPAAVAAAVASCAAIGLGVWAVDLHSHSGGPSALHAVALRGAGGSLVVARDGEATLVLTGLAPAPQGKTYEAWVIDRGVAAPAGTFAGGGTATLRLTHPVPDGATVAVTVELAGGVSQPTTKPVVVSASA